MCMLANVSFFPPPEEEREEGWKFNHLCLLPLGAPLSALPQTTSLPYSPHQMDTEGLLVGFHLPDQSNVDSLSLRAGDATFYVPSFGWRFEENKTFISEFFS